MLSLSSVVNASRRESSFSSFQKLRGGAVTVRQPISLDDSILNEPSYRDAVSSEGEEVFASTLIGKKPPATETESIERDSPAFGVARVRDLDVETESLMGVEFAETSSGSVTESSEFETSVQGSSTPTPTPRQPPKPLNSKSAFSPFARFQKKQAAQVPKLESASREEIDLLRSQVLAESLSREYHFKRHQIGKTVAAYNAVFPQPQSDPEQFVQTLPLVAVLAAEIGEAMKEGYTLTMTDLEMWELLTGFVYTCPASPEPVLDVINRDVQAAAATPSSYQRNDLQRILSSMCTGRDQECFLDLQERTRRQVVRTVGAASTLPLEAADDVGGGHNLRVLGTQKEVFYRPELLGVSAVFANTFDATQAPELFNYLVRRRCAGVWGPRRAELMGILRDRAYRLDESEFPADKEQLVMGREFIQKHVGKALQLMREATERDARMCSADISVLDGPLSKELVMRGLIEGSLASTINACSSAELAELDRILNVILQEHEAAAAEYEQIKGRVLRGAAVGDKRSARCLSKDPVRIVRSVSSPSPSATGQQVKNASSNSTAQQGSSRRRPATSDDSRQPLSTRILSSLSRLSPLSHAPKAPTAPQHQTKTLDDVVEGALQIIKFYRKAAAADSSEEFRAAAFEESNLLALRSFFLNTCSHQNVKSLVLAVLRQGRSYPTFKERGGEFLYAAYLLTIADRGGYLMPQQMSDRLIMPMMEKLRELQEKLARRKGLFSGASAFAGGSGEWTLSSEEGEGYSTAPESFSDAYSDGSESFFDEK